MKTSVFLMYGRLQQRCCRFGKRIEKIFFYSKWHGDMYLGDT